MASRKGVRPSRPAGSWSVILNDKCLGKFPTKQEAEEAMPGLFEAHRLAALENLTRLRKEAALARGNTPETKRERKLRYGKEYRQKNKERLNKCSQEYREKNKEKLSEYERSRNNKKAIARESGTVASTPPRTRGRGRKSEGETGLETENRIQAGHQMVKEGKLKALRGSVGCAADAVDPNRQILRTEHLPTYDWSKRHYQR